MSEVNASDLRIINDPSDVWTLYRGVGCASKIGAEIELSFLDPQASDLAPMTVPQNHAVRDATNEALATDSIHNEPTADMLEVGTIATSPEDLRHVLADAQDKIQMLQHIAHKAGLKRSYFQELPEKTDKELFQNLMDISRYQAFFGPPRADMVDIAAYFAVCKSNQVSVSYRDHDHMLDNVRRLYALAPFLFLLTDNSCGFDRGQPFSGHSGMYHRAALGARGGVPSHLFTAETGEDYIKSHIDNVMSNPLFVYYDEMGDLVRLPSGTWTSFNELKERGLNTATNYFFSQSVLWPDVKIAALKDQKGEVVNHRYEARMFGVGAHQHQTALLMTAALAFDDEFAAQIDRLLSEFGFSFETPEATHQTQKHLEQAYKAACFHDGAFFDIAYGTGSLKIFAQKFGRRLEQSAQAQDFKDALSPALYICETGLTDGLINRRLFPTLSDVMDQQRNYDPEIMNNPNQCAAQIFIDKIDIA